MTEENWLKSEEPVELLRYPSSGPINERRFRLAAAAISRQSYPSAANPSLLPQIELAEQLADGQATDDERIAAHRRLSRRLGTRPARALLNWRACQGVFQLLEALAYVDPPFGETPAQRRSSWATLVRDIFGNPFRPVTFDPSWRTANVLDLARTIYDERAFERLPILADALMDAGCSDEQILEHCRSELPHVRGCWLLDLALDKK